MTNNIVSAPESDVSRMIWLESALCNVKTMFEAVDVITDSVFKSEAAKLFQMSRG